MLSQPDSPIHRARTNEQPYWGLSGAAGSLFLAFAVYVVFSAPLFLVLKSLERRDDLLFGVIDYQLLAAGVVASALAFVLLRFHVAPDALGFRIPQWRAVLFAIASLPLIYIGIGIIVALFQAIGFDIRGNAQDILQTKHHHYGIAEQALVVVWAAIEAPLVEETLFRGIIYQGLRQFFARFVPFDLAIGAGAVLSGIVFGLAHFEPHTLPVLALLGIALALIFQYTRSLYVSALIHGAVNAISVIVTLHS